MLTAYSTLARLGYAHSVETWAGDELVGGLYGVVIGRMFFGESMFARRTDASKVALVRQPPIPGPWQLAAGIGENAPVTMSGIDGEPSGRA